MELQERWATFDCYGTLVDWERGIGDALAAMWPAADRAKLLARYHEIEPDIQAGAALPYREVMARASAEVGRNEGFERDPARRYALAESLPSWPVFAEVPDSLKELRRRGWRLAILSNTDPDLLAASIRRIGIAPDLTITAAEAGSYKPAHGHWQRFRDLSGALPAAHVHVGASLFHDIAPAAELGIPAVWINRLGQTSALPRAAELPDLSKLAETLDGLVPAV